MARLELRVILRLHLISGIELIVVPKILETPGVNERDHGVDQVAHVGRERGNGYLQNKPVKKISFQGPPPLIQLEH